ncbi:MAG: SGNH/GDSL hydrolase family protein [Alistipes sp.]|nr:SGNH/GDSL hydrolase family protein [Alistipes sp.]
MRHLLRIAVLAVALITMAAGSESLTAKTKGGQLNLKRPLKVVCLGNSLTHHGYLAEIEWYGDWGMAASKRENDFCHVLEKELQQYNRKSEVSPLNIYGWEINPTCDLDSLAGEVCHGADVIILRMCDNVRDIEAFEQNMGRLIEFCPEKTPHVIVAGTFWRNERYERILAASAERYGLEYVDLGWITLLNDIYPKVGDTLYDIEGKPYTITKDIIIGHPNDKGMRLIAHSLMRAIKYLAR